RRRGIRSLAITFNPHPIAVLAPAPPPHLLTPRNVKLRYLAELGLDLVWVLPFSRSLAALTPEEFLDSILLPAIAPEELWVGHDFRFGHDRRGDYAFLQRAGERYGFSAHRFAAVSEGGRILSSSVVRAALVRGDVADAESVLGHSFLLEGPVGTGQGLGRKLFVPTANLDLEPERLLPADGVYPAWAEVEGRLVPSVVSIGTRPTVTDDSRRVVEAYLLDWDGDLRGRVLPLHLGPRLRPQEKFRNAGELRDAIAVDVRNTRDWLAAHPAPASGEPARTFGPPETKR
ncbi:MAG: riboflavin biosynthesis protein RibF, partial [Candidatus Eisenbacteria bacterium]|nr:riboflavin biosynthesis protein RibF [Candidatus Eisenbacteria bacterium]